MLNQVRSETSTMVANLPVSMTKTFKSESKRRPAHYTPSYLGEQFEIPPRYQS